MYPQMHLLFTALKQFSEGLTKRKNTIIVESEATGHTHRLVEGRVLEEARGRLFLDVLRAPQVVHREHRALHLALGTDAVTRQREDTPAAIRVVRDGA